MIYHHGYIVLLTASTLALYERVALQVEIPKSVQDALWLLLIGSLGGLGLWVKGKFKAMSDRAEYENERLRLDLKTAKDNHDAVMIMVKSATERVATLEGVTERQNKELEKQDRVIDDLRKENKARDIELGKAQERGQQTEKERDKLKTDAATMAGEIASLKLRADLRHDAVNKSESGRIAAEEYSKRLEDHIAAIILLIPPGVTVPPIPPSRIPGEAAAIGNAIINQLSGVPAKESSNSTPAPNE